MHAGRRCFDDQVCDWLFARVSSILCRFTGDFEKLLCVRFSFGSTVVKRNA